MSSLAVLSTLLSLAFLGLGVWTLVQWWRHRTRSSGLLAAAFGSLAVAITVHRIDALTPLDIPWPAVDRGLNLILAVFPWLLAWSVWTLSGHRPRWSWIGIVGVPVVSGWLIFAPLTGTPPHPVEIGLLLASFGLLWTVAAVATALHLRRAAGHHLLARPRMRLMATGLLITTAALLTDLVGIATGSVTVELAMNAIAVVGATTFLVGFMAPRPLRWWWRRDSMTGFQRMQADMLAALSRHDVAQAVATPLSVLVGSGVLVVDESGELLERAGIGSDPAASIARQLAADEPVDERVQVASVGHGWLAVVANPYTPIFGQDERDLLDAYATHTRIALERAKLFEVIATQHRDLETMLLGIAHDIRTPATTIRGFAELQVDTDDADQRREFAEHIATSTAYLDRLVDAMMELGQVRNTAGQSEPVDLPQVAQQVADRVAGAHPGIRIDVLGDAAAVVMSPLHAEQLFDNLLTNAVKHGGRADLTVTVEITAGRPGGVELVVADDGVGIVAADQQRIFTPFQRGTQARGEGSGLGLGLVSRIVTGAGGRLTLAPSERGARFHIELPEHAVAAHTPAVVTRAGP